MRKPYANAIIKNAKNTGTQLKTFQQYTIDNRLFSTSYGYILFLQQHADSMQHCHAHPSPDTMVTYMYQRRYWQCAISQTTNILFPYNNMQPLCTIAKPPPPPLPLLAPSPSGQLDRSCRSPRCEWHFSWGCRGECSLASGRSGSH